MLKAKKLLYNIWRYLTIIPTYAFAAHIKAMRKIVIWTGDDATKIAYNLILDRMAKAFTEFKL